MPWTRAEETNAGDCQGTSFLSYCISEFRVNIKLVSIIKCVQSGNLTGDRSNEIWQATVVDLA
jgi:hypothetical protein